MMKLSYRALLSGAGLALLIVSMDASAVAAKPRIKSSRCGGYHGECHDPLREKFQSRSESHSQLPSLFQLCSCLPARWGEVLTVRLDPILTLDKNLRDLSLRLRSRQMVPSSTKQSNVAASNARDR